MSNKNKSNSSARNHASKKGNGAGKRSGNPAVRAAALKQEAEVKGIKSTFVPSTTLDGTTSAEPKKINQNKTTSSSNTLKTPGGKFAKVVLVTAMCGALIGGPFITGMVGGGGHAGHNHAPGEGHGVVQQQETGLVDQNGNPINSGTTQTVDPQDVIDNAGTATIPVEVEPNKNGQQKDSNKQDSKPADAEKSSGK